jgi:ubiquinone/menaquinone biosynthesis C-methylase UbiE
MTTPRDAGRTEDEWTCLDDPEAAAIAIAKLEALGESAAERAARDRYLGWLDIQPGQALLDVGAGTGRIAIELARRTGRDGRVLALEPSPQLAAYGRDAATRAGVGDVVEWRTGRAEQLPLPDGAIDRSVCRWVLLHVADTDAVVREMRRVTRPRGRVMCVEADWDTVTVYPSERDLTRTILRHSCDRHVEGRSGRRIVPCLRRVRARRRGSRAGRHRR